MRRTSLMTMGLAAAVALATISGADAQTATPAAPDAMATPDASATPIKPKPKAAKPKPPSDQTTAEKPKAKAKTLPFVSVTVTNGRSVGLVELTATISGGAGDSVKVAGPLAAGKKTIAHLAHEKDCLFDVHGVYEDGATVDEAGMDLCKDKKLNLIE